MGVSFTPITNPYSCSPRWAWNSKACGLKSWNWQLPIPTSSACPAVLLRPLTCFQIERSIWEERTHVQTSRTLYPHKPPPPQSFAPIVGIRNQLASVTSYEVNIENWQTHVHSRKTKGLDQKKCACQGIAARLSSRSCLCCADLTIASCVSGILSISKPNAHIRCAIADMLYHLNCENISAAKELSG